MSLINQMAVVQGGARKRHTRTPNFPLAGVIQPYSLQPVWAHPVLPGETCQSISMKYRVVSMPLANPLSGAWLESWFVYVKLTDIDKDLGEMFIKDTVSSSSYQAAASDPRYFVKSGDVDWIQLATKRIHERYFLDEGETARKLSTMPQVKLNNAAWYQNMVFEAADQAVPTTDASDLYEHLTGWAMLQQMQMTELTYEQYLETYGVRPVETREGDPEILRFSRSWTLPNNTVDPSSGAPSSAWFWSEEVALKGKPKRFVEPGFIICLQCVRPKMFQKHIEKSFVGNMWGFSDWFPSYNLQDPTAGVKELAKTDTIFAAAATDGGSETLLYDHRDVLSHGESFVNVDFADADLKYPLPASTGLSVKTGATAQDIRGEYCKEADILALFKGAQTSSEHQINYEGIAMLNLSGHITDSTRG